MQASTSRCIPHGIAFISTAYRKLLEEQQQGHTSCWSLAGKTQLLQGTANRARHVSYDHLQDLCSRLSNCLCQTHCHIAWIFWSCRPDVWCNTCLHASPAVVRSQNSCCCTRQNNDSKQEWCIWKASKHRRGQCFSTEVHWYVMDWKFVKRIASN